MSHSDFVAVVKDVQANKPLGYMGRAFEYHLFGSTDVYHRITCYVPDYMRMAVRMDMAVNGMTEEQVVAKYRDYISLDAPCLR